MQPVDVFVAAYLVGAIVLLCILSILAYRKQVKMGVIKDEKAPAKKKK